MKKGVKIGIIAAIIIAIGIAVFIFIKKKKSTVSTTDTSTDTSTSTTNPDTTNQDLQKKVTSNINTYNSIAQGGSTLTSHGKDIIPEGVSKNAVNPTSHGKGE